MEDICNIYPQITTLNKKPHNIKWKVETPMIINKIYIIETYI